MKCNRTVLYFCVQCLPLPSLPSTLILNEYGELCICTCELRERERETDRQTDRQTETQRERETERETERERQRQRENHLVHILYFSTFVFTDTIGSTKVISAIS